MFKAILILVVLFSACGGDEDEAVPSCTQAMTNNFENGCGLSMNGEPLTLDETIHWCNDLTTDVYQIGGNCPERFDALLRCFDSVANNSQCESCNDEIGILQGCE